MHSSHTTEALAARIGAAAVLVLLLDYDGTLVPFAPIPALAEPDDQLVALLRDLADRPNTEVHVVSGRTQEALERWLGALPIGLHAEHGLLSRPAGDLRVGDGDPCAAVVASRRACPHAGLRRADPGRPGRGEERRRRVALPARGARARR